MRRPGGLSLQSGALTLYVLLLSVSLLHAQHLTGSSGTKLGMTAGTVLKITGNLSHAGTASFPAASTLVFSGSGPVNLTGITSVGNLSIVGGGDVTLKNNLTLSGTLQLSSGRLILGDHDCTLGSSSAIAGTPSASAMIVTDGSGSLRRAWSGLGSFTYPVGDGISTVEYSPATLNFTAGTFSSAVIGVRVSDAKHSQNSSSTDYLTRYWTISGSGVSNFSSTVSNVYVQADVVGTEANLNGALWNGSDWTKFGPVATVSNTITGTISEFGVITAGEPGAVPVELTHFSAVDNGVSVLLQWRTATEMNSYRFDVERRATGDWSVVASVPAAGSSAHPLKYRVEDVLTAQLQTEQILYYRLKQIDRDGSFSFSPVAEVSRAPSVAAWQLGAPSPHPFGDELNVHIDVGEETTLEILLVDLLGRELRRFPSQRLARGSHILPMRSAALPVGPCLLVVRDGSKQLVRRVLHLR